MRFLFLLSHLSLSFIFCSETQIIFGYQGGASFQEPGNWTVRRDLPHLSELTVQDTRVRQPSSPWQMPSWGQASCHCLAVLVSTFMTPEPSSKCTFKTKLKCLFHLSPIIFQFPVALHFLRALTGDLNTDPEDVASHITSALWDGQNDLFFENVLFFFSHFPGSEQGRRQYWVSGFGKVKLN